MIPIHSGKVLLATVLSGATALHVAPAYTEDATPFELKRELERVDQELAKDRSRQAAVVAVHAALSPVSTRLSAVDMREVTAKGVALVGATEAFLNANAAAISGRGDEQSRAKARQQRERLWAKLDADLRGFVSEIDAILNEIGRVLSQLYVRQPSNEEVSALLDDLQRDFETDFQRVRQALDDVRQFTLDPRSIEALERLKTTTLPALNKLLPTLSTKVQAAVTALRERLETEQQRVAAAIKEKDDRQRSLSREIGSREQGQARIDTTLIKFALPSFGVLLIGLLVVPKLYQRESQQSIFQSGLLLELVTVFLLTATILMLGIAGKLSGEVLGTLIGGISGYVLGRWKKREEAGGSNDGSPAVRQSGDQEASTGAETARALPRATKG